MPAGPFPTKVMHEALKARVETLENTTPSAGGSSGPAYLSDRVLLDTRGTREIDPAEIPDGLSVRSCTLTLAPTAEPLTFSALEGGVRSAFAGMFVSVAASPADFDAGRLLFDGYANAGEVLVPPQPVTVPPGGVLGVGFEMDISQADGQFRADPALPPDLSYVADVRGNLPPGLVVGLPFTLFNPRTVLGSLAPDAMNVRAAPSTLANGDFEIVDPGNAPPTLRYRASSGTVYRVAMTPE